jgi:hypothetical protein
MPTAEKPQIISLQFLWYGQWDFFHWFYQPANKFKQNQYFIRTVYVYQSTCYIRVIAAMKTRHYKLFFNKHLRKLHILQVFTYQHLKTCNLFVIGILQRTYAIRNYELFEAHLHIILTLTQEKGGWSASCPGSLGKGRPVYVGQKAELTPYGVWTLLRK